MTEYQHRKRMTNNGLIWHYTSLSVLERFLQGEIAFSHYKFMNDEKDLAYGHEFVAALSAEVSSESLSGMVAKNPYFDSINKGDYYLFCLSGAADSLYQWRSYTPNGGVAIGFKCADLYNAIFDCVDADERFSEESPDLRFLRCRYKDDVAKKLLLRLAANFEGCDLENCYKEHELKHLCLLMDAVVRTVFSQKNPSFQSEKEVRILLSGKIRRHVEIIGGKPRIVLRSQSLSSPIAEVMLSPHGDTMRNRLIVEMLRDKHNLDFTISTSESSYNGK